MKEESEREDLRVRTKKFALRVIRLFTALPKRTESEVIGKQLLRSGTSIGANFREAHRTRSDAEFVSKLGDCLKELEESCYWLELLVDAEGQSRSTYFAPGRMQSARRNPDHHRQEGEISSQVGSSFIPHPSSLVI